MVALNPWPDRENVIPSPGAKSIPDDAVALDKLFGAHDKMQSYVLDASSCIGRIFALLVEYGANKEGWTDEKDREFGARLAQLRCNLIQMYRASILLPSGKFTQEMLEQSFTQDCAVLRLLMEESGFPWEIGSVTEG